MDKTQLLEVAEIELTMEERILRGVSRMNKAVAMENQTTASPVYTLRDTQTTVFNDFAAYLLEVATRPSRNDELSMSRIILPPRTGKTVIAAHCIGTTALCSLFIVPTRTLVDQVAEEFRARLPGIPVGTYYGEEKKLVDHGVNVTTYNILQQQWKAQECLPRQVRNAALIFADEAHHSMTKPRLTMLREGFDPKAIRVALTATPDYDDERKLAGFFPELIHEITLPEAVQLELVAPLRVWVYEVDEDASMVTMVAGDYHEETISRLMSSAPFFEATKTIRYSPENLFKQALICCRTRQQAYDLHKYLLQHRPADTPKPQLILSTTDKNERQDILRKYEIGWVDTIVSVAVLTEGWSSPKCKLLIDLSPSLSLVRATQKFFRPMTKYEEREASVYILVPTNLPQPPILPMELFHWSEETYESGTLVASAKRQKHEASLPSLKRHRITPIEKVRLKSRVLVCARFEKPALDPKDADQIRQVMGSNSNLFEDGRLCGLQRFRWLLFSHLLFSGRGEQLLRYLKVTSSREGYIAYMARLFPEEAASRFFYYSDRTVEDVAACQKELLAFETKLLEGSDKFGEVNPDYEYSYKALAGPLAREPEPTPEEALHQKELRLTFPSLFFALRPIEQDILIRRFGLGGEEEQTLKKVGDCYNLSRERIRGIESQALFKLRRGLLMRDPDLIE